MRLCNLVYQDMIEAMNRSWGGRDSQSILVLQQERAGVASFALTVEQMAGVMERS
jgi:3-hydroxyisobutyrate dehydrogenase